MTLKYRPAKVDDRHSVGHLSFVIGSPRPFGPGLWPSGPQGRLQHQRRAPYLTCHAQNLKLPTWRMPNGATQTGT